jgi:hypothetical protein
MTRTAVARPKMAHQDISLNGKALIRRMLPAGGDSRVSGHSARARGRFAWPTPLDFGA